MRKPTIENASTIGSGFVRACKKICKSDARGYFKQGLAQVENRGFTSYALRDLYRFACIQPQPTFDRCNSEQKLQSANLMSRLGNEHLDEDDCRTHCSITDWTSRYHPDHSTCYEVCSDCMRYPFPLPIVGAYSILVQNIGELARL